MTKKCLWVPQNWIFFKKIFLAKIFLENLSKWTKNIHPEVFSGVKFNSKTFLFSSLWPKNASKCLKIEFFGKLVNLGQTLTCRDSMGLQLIGLRDPSHLIIYQYVPHMSYAAIRKFLRGYHNHRMCNSEETRSSSHGLLVLQYNLQHSERLVGAPDRLRALTNTVGEAIWALRLFSRGRSIHSKVQCRITWSVGCNQSKINYILHMGTLDTLICIRNLKIHCIGVWSSHSSPWKCQCLTHRFGWALVTCEWHCSMELSAVAGMLQLLSSMWASARAPAGRKPLPPQLNCLLNQPWPSDIGTRPTHLLPISLVSVITNNK